MVKLAFGTAIGIHETPLLFVFFLDSRDKANLWNVDEWPNRIPLTVVNRNIINPSLGDHEEIIFPPLYTILRINETVYKSS